MATVVADEQPDIQSDAPLSKLKIIIRFKQTHTRTTNHSKF